MADRLLGIIGPLPRHGPNLWYIWIIPGLILASAIALVRYDFIITCFSHLYLFPLSSISQRTGNRPPHRAGDDLLSGLFILVVLQNPRTLTAPFFRHPITILLLLHLVWIFTRPLPVNTSPDRQ